MRAREWGTYNLGSHSDSSLRLSSEVVSEPSDDGGESTVGTC